MKSVDPFGNSTRGLPSGVCWIILSYPGFTLRPAYVIIRRTICIPLPAKPKGIYKLN